MCVCGGGGGGGRCVCVGGGGLLKLIFVATTLAFKATYVNIAAYFF